ncbi:MAG: flagellar biosynthesis protein FlhB [Gammaproteobacteria bacterium]|nr:flagellar biosynthesis protein FlhB [Gammaproteobacteria bacterium]MDH5629966.1 flagellar biosynthesis protein FlhB [Gammaproteobacteria bacterium]
MAEQSAGERTEKATPKRVKEAKDKGQVARSKELTTALLLMVASTALYSFSDNMAGSFADLARKAWTPGHKAIYNPYQMVAAVGELFGLVAYAVLPFFIVLFVLALMSPMLTGGMAFSSKALKPQLSRISPGKGFKRMFGMNALIELVKALAKVSVVFLVGYFVLNQSFPKLLSLGSGNVLSGVENAISLVLGSFFLLSLSLLFIAFIDVPYQLWNHAKQLKMTKQEIKDEFKEVEGKPEVKGKIRQLQREMAQRRMMEAIPDADVVVTNPTHYSVAIKYDPMNASAPIVVAKGADVIAMQIRKVALANDVAIMSAPPLARAIYHTTEIDQEIPGGLYMAVAQVLAYVFQLSNYEKGRGERPIEPDNLPIPDDMKF